MTFEFIMTFIGGLIIGAAIGFFGARHLIKKNFENNPSAMFPDEVLKALLQSTGQTPNAKKLKMMRKQMNDAAKKNK